MILHQMDLADAFQLQSSLC